MDSDLEVYCRTGKVKVKKYYTPCKETEPFSE